MEDALLERYRLSLRQMLDLFIDYANRDPEFATYKQHDPELCVPERKRPLSALVRVETTIEPLDENDIEPNAEALRFRMASSPALKSTAIELFEIS